MGRADRGAALIAGAIALATAPAFAAPAKAPDPPPLPPLTAVLKIMPGAGGGPWRLQIENTTEEPIRVVADPRLLVLELTPPAAETTTKKAAKPAAPPRCILPDDTRPSSDEGRELVIPAKRSWSASFDPYFYCFGARERAALVAGTTVKAKFGWPVTTKPGAKTPAPKPPFAASPAGASVGKVAPVKALEADTFTLSDAMTATRSTGPSSESDASGVTVAAPASMDAARGAELGTTVTLTNTGERAITLLYRPEVVLFSVYTPAGSISCGFPRQVASPIRELFSTVGVKGRADTSVLFTTTCPPGTFDEPGVYRVYPRIDTTGTSGRAIGLRTWDGTATAKTPLLLRVRHSRKPTIPPAPTLD